MDKVDYLPLGSIVRLEGGVKKIIIVGRGLTVRINNEVYFMDYAGFQYPEGLIGDQAAYFNHTDIEQIIFRGYSDDENEILVRHINKYAENDKVVRGNAKELAENSRR